jgi:hypothetical protein
MTGISKVVNKISFLKDINQSGLKKPDSKDKNVVSK